jgi:hypothetical protein
MATVSIKFGSSYANASQFIHDFMVNLYSGSFPTPATFLQSASAVDVPDLSIPGSGGESGLLVAKLNAGGYSFTVSGNSGDFPSYAGTVSVSVSPVPLPASLPMFGGALLALAGFSYGMNRWVAPKHKAAKASA